MKYLIVVVLLIAGCDHPVDPPIGTAGYTKGYTRIVYNSCTGQYAILTGHMNVFNRYNLSGTEQDTYVGSGSSRLELVMGTIQCLYMEGTDTTWYATLGNEMTFADSLAAQDYITRQKVKDDSAEAKKKEDDLLALRRKRIDDSIFKCRHMYQ